MTKYAIVAIVAAVSAVAAARMISAFEPEASAPPPQAAVAMAEPTVGPASISKAADGHYWADADVDGRAVRFLVDTGASAVALTSEDAQRLGIDPSTLDYRFSVVTASGEARAAQVKLASISVAGAQVDNVDAFVIDHGLQTSLLGMTYLGRLSAFEATPQSLILRP
ncbi:MAG TPA: TIGR02281 family clan AA aspartic protease [Caulobacteraceae bacterium]|jgi:aspartyl protease family protein|nr:TIGR02281 family clan AA aspartic protease [Caulobacteraceae bacterium]